MWTETDWLLCYPFTQACESARLRALFVRDVANPDGHVRREIKLGAQQTKGAKGRTVVLSSRVRNEIVEYLRVARIRDQTAPLILSQRNGRAFSNVTLSML